MVGIVEQVVVGDVYFVDQVVQGGVVVFIEEGIDVGIQYGGEIIVVLEFLLEVIVDYEQFLDVFVVEQFV